MGCILESYLKVILADFGTLVVPFKSHCWLNVYTSGDLSKYDRLL